MSSAKTTADSADGSNATVSMDDKDKTSTSEEGAAVGESWSATGEDDEEEEEGLKEKVDKVEGNLIKSLEQVQQESEATRDKIQKLTTYLKMMDAAPNEINPNEEGAYPYEESQTNEASISEMVGGGDVDVIAQAAILAGLQERAEVTSQEESSEIMEPVQPSETDHDNVVIAGEIVGPQMSLTLTKHQAEGEVTMTGVEEDPSLQGDTASPKIAYSKGEQTLETKSKGQSPKESEESVEALPSSSSHTPSKKPKRQLAVSFMNDPNRT